MPSIGSRTFHFWHPICIGIVELELESTKALTLLLFIIPLAFSLSAFLLWIIYHCLPSSKEAKI
ncbi:hypothetical protein CPC08DRAFT_128638 [Agrocybe pediades]|nr:hypothetical protein CPC08DRAFT_128638 [Agrocybe pediades]